MIISGNIGTFIAAAAATAALIVLEVLLARKKRFLFGLIPVISVALLFLGIGLYAVHVQGTYTVREDSYKYPGGAAAVISLRLDRESRIVSFSDLDIYDSRGKLQDTAIFSAADKGESMYAAAEKYFVNKYSLTGFSVAKESVTGTAFSAGTDDYYASSSPGAFFRCGGLLAAALLIIFFIERLIMRGRRQKEELRKLGIEIGL